MAESGTDESIGDLIGEEIRQAQLVHGGTSQQRLEHLRRAQEYIFHHDADGSLLDNFLEEMMGFTTDNDPKIVCFVAGFVDEACKKDMEMIKKVLSTISWLMASTNVSVVKKVINVATHIYPAFLAWFAKLRNPDTDAHLCWEGFAILKGKIMQNMDSENEGIRTQTIKFLEACILVQTSKTPQSEGGRPDAMSLDQIPRDHKFISFRKLETESKQLIVTLLDSMSSAHISSLNLLTIISCLANIARQRPDELEKVLSALETLHVNLPPTLGTSQVKSVRKELKMHLLRFLAHKTSEPYHSKITTLLTDLGASQQEVLKALPSGSDFKRRINRVDDPSRKRPKLEDDDATAGTSGDQQPIAIVIDDDDADDDDGEIKKTQSAIDITAQYLLEHLTPRNVADLVLISMVTLPDTMPASFQASYTPIAAAGTEAQISRLARLMAIQFTNSGIGPGIEQTRREMRERYESRQSARNEGAIVAPTPMHVGGASTSASAMPPPPPPKTPHPGYGVLGNTKQSKRMVQFGLTNVTRPMEPEKRSDMIVSAFDRIINNEKRALQGGAASAHLKLLIRLSTRFEGALQAGLQQTLLHYIMADIKSRSDLSVLWVYESYAQHATNVSDDIDGIDRFNRYDNCLCTLLGTLFEREEHKETLFHKILLEAPIITPNALDWLKRACLDKTYGAFGMTTLREMILTRPRQRGELLCILLDFSYYERSDLKAQSLETAKELFQFEAIRPDVKEHVTTILEYVLLSRPPAVLFGDDKERAASAHWDDASIRACLYLYLNLLPLEHSLIDKLADVYASASTDVKRVMLRVLEAPVKAMGMHSDALLHMLDNCPLGAETLVARIVHLLTERNAPTSELIVRVKNLHNSRSTDVRSLIPVLTGLDKEEILKALPKFVLSVTNQRSVPNVFKRLLFGKNIESGIAPMTPVELMVQLHKIETRNNDELKLLIAGMNQLYQMTTTFTKEVLAGVIQDLLDLDPMPALTMRTILQALSLFPALNGFIMNVLHRLIGRQVWTQPKLWEGFVKCCQKTKPQCFQVLLHLPADQLRALFVASKQGNDDLQAALCEHVRSLSGHQQAHIPADILKIINKESTISAAEDESNRKTTIADAEPSVDERPESSQSASDSDVVNQSSEVVG